ncbi:HlyC/CorC family transporter [Nakamurella flavida]|uniref:HlyC/CorC family transporter n=1 Tax=Nakamurella flavida TaxID=363630 RepID=A0A939C472_9ACTN|nr:hemolysin family protein [Nakamurella flavida]MBM9475379.1 HlyC/CorC family transporter [Nakamurella flavida]MDP9776959.1 CBS domain containing-hemolysin-like protein [Nakamurella flavida]
MITNWLLLLLVVVLLGVSAFFVAAEFSLIAARRSVIEPLAVSSKRARATLKAMENVSLMMACAQFGITLCGVLLGALGEPAVASLLEPVFHDLGVPEGWLHPVALTVALLLVVSAHVALGEMVPKNIAIAGPEKTAMALAPPLQAVATMLGPIIRVLNFAANGIVRMLGREPKDEVASAFTREEVADLISESRAEGLLDADEHQLITSALDLDVAEVRTVLVPEDAVVTLAAGASPAEVERACQRTGFSRFPIREADGRLSGYLHIRDVVGRDDDRDEPIPTERIRPLPVVSADTDLRTALDTMRRLGAHLAQVVVPERATPVSTGSSPMTPGGSAPTAAPADASAPESHERGAGHDPAGTEPGDLLGVVMLEDVIETLIGEIRDATRRGPWTAAAGRDAGRA